MFCYPRLHQLLSSLTGFSPFPQNRLLESARSCPREYVFGGFLSLINSRDLQGMAGWQRPLSSVYCSSPVGWAFSMESSLDLTNVSISCQIVFVESWMCKSFKALMVQGEDNFPRIFCFRPYQVFGPEFFVFHKSRTLTISRNGTFPLLTSWSTILLNFAAGFS